jgi:mannose-6-phosphate isomerase-like protein (cupin superfamily)
MDSKTPSLRPAVVSLDQAQALVAFGLHMRVLLSTESAGGLTSIVIKWHEPGEGAPDHVHFSQEEVFFIIEGTYEVTVNGGTSIIGPNSLVFLPRNTVHRFKNIGSAKACMLEWTMPGGQDRYYKEISSLTGNRGFVGEQVLAVSRKHDTFFPANTSDGPSVRAARAGN